MEDICLLGLVTIGIDSASKIVEEFINFEVVKGMLHDDEVR